MKKLAFAAVLATLSTGAMAQTVVVPPVPPVAPVVAGFGAGLGTTGLALIPIGIVAVVAVAGT